MRDERGGETELCSVLSLAAGEPLSATATHVRHWLLLEVPGAWPRDVSDDGPLAPPVREALSGWLARTPQSRVLFIRRPARADGPPAVYRVRAEERVAETSRIQVATHADLADVDLDGGGEPHDPRLVVVCAHGSRDRCCSLRGTAVCRALGSGAELRDDELWLSSHHGGHRFAGNALVLPLGLHLGRLDSASAPNVVASALAGQIELDHYRGRTFYAPPVQAAEHAVREVTGLVGVDDLRLAGVEDAVVRLVDADGREHETLVEELAGPVVPASCGAVPEAQPRFTARLL
jgi:hypothetical protein